MPQVVTVRQSIPNTPIVELSGPLKYIYVVSESYWYIMNKDNDVFVSESYAHTSSSSLIIILSYTLINVKPYFRLPASLRPSVRNASVTHFPLYGFLADSTIFHLPNVTTRRHFFRIQQHKLLAYWFSNIVVLPFCLAFVVSLCCAIRNSYLTNRQ
jgi:hypothetical protein